MEMGESVDPPREERARDHHLDSTDTSTNRRTGGGGNVPLYIPGLPAFAAAVAARARAPVTGILAAALLLSSLSAEDIRLAAPAEAARFDPAEFRLEVEAPAAANPFTEVELMGEFRALGGSAVTVHGFCDSADGALHLLRFSPERTGDHSWSIRYRSPAADRTF